MNESTTKSPTPVRENLLGARIVAGIIDLVILAIVGVIFSMLFGDSSSSGGGFSVSLSGVPFIIFCLVCLGYYFGMEASNGQAVGKMAMKIKVVGADGELTPGKIVVRTILRIVDGIFFYVVAVVVIAASKGQQRIGDMATGTNVVRA